MTLISKRSALLKTSAATDVKWGSGIVSITGLQPFNVADVTSARQIKYKTEVVQVIKVGGGSYTPTGATKYTIKLVNPAFQREGVTIDTSKSYSFTTPVNITDIGATAALQREAIHVALIASINADARNFVVAATLAGGTGFSITDDAGYYPARLNGASSGRRGATLVITVHNADGSGWTAAVSQSTTTNAVYNFGEGTRMIDDKPIIASMTGNLVSGELDAPVAADGTFATSGQQYDAFSFQLLKNTNIPTISGITGYELFDQAVFVDNGKGSSVTNLAGFIAFEREALRVVLAQYRDDVNASVDFFDNALIASATYPTTGAAITTTDNVVMAENSGKNVWYVNPIGAHTLLTPLVTNTGLSLILDAADEEGIELSTPNLTSCPKSFVVGSQEFSLYAKFTATNYAHLEEFIIGFRKLTNTAANQNYAATPAAYDAAGNDFAGLGSPGDSASGLQEIATSLASGGVVTTSTVKTFTSGAHDYEIRVMIDGSVRFFLDSVEFTSLQATAFKFAAGAVVIPFIMTVLDANVDAAPFLVQTAAVADANWRV